jgi:carboxyl-terminal processing protease
MKYLKNLIAKINWVKTRHIFKRFLVIAGIVLSVCVLIGGGFYFGYSYGRNTPKNIVIKGVSNIERGVNSDVDFSVFWQAWDLLKNNYLNGTQLKDQDLVYGAIEGLISSAGDPHTVFFTPDDSQKFAQDIQGEFGGIGAELEVKNNYVVVVAPLEDTPASRGGIKAGDKILAVDNQVIQNADVNDAVKRIRGLVGTKVVLTILSNGDVKSKNITLTRETITVPTLKWQIKDNNIAYVQLFSFNEKASYLFYKAAMEIMSSDAKGMVLDLRNDPGGYLEVAVNIAGWFFNKGQLVVAEAPRNGDKTNFLADGTGAFKNMPMVVLVNKGSASASEILAGALRDNNKIKLIGETTFGKGTVQDLENLKDGSQIKMTIAKWLLPSGNGINKEGLAPDIEVKITDQDVVAKKDSQLDRALEEVQKIISTK